MYIIISGEQYSCSKRIKKTDTLEYLSVDRDPGTVTGAIKMYRDDGFLLSEDDAGDYSRQKYAGTRLTLTNLPEPEPQKYVPTDTDVLNALLGVI